MRVKKGVVVQKMGDTFVCYDNESSTLHEINEVAFTIISEIEKGKGKIEILDKLVGDYKVEKVRAEKDLNSFLNELKAKNLIVGTK